MTRAFIVALWAAVTVSVYAIEFLRLHLTWIGNKQPFNRKPFNCEVCLPFWLFAAFLAIAIKNHTPVALLAGACTAGIISCLLFKKLRK